MTTTTYTNQELRLFESILEPFRVNKVLRGGHKISYIDLDEYLVSKGIFAKGQGGYGPSIRELKIREYEEFQDKLEQLQKLKGRIQYAKRKELEQQAESAS